MLRFLFLAVYFNLFLIIGFCQNINDIYNKLTLEQRVALLFLPSETNWKSSVDINSPMQLPISGKRVVYRLGYANNSEMSDVISAQTIEASDILLVKELFYQQLNQNTNTIGLIVSSLGLESWMLNKNTKIPFVQYMCLMLNSKLNNKTNQLEAWGVIPFPSVFVTNSVVNNEFNTQGIYKSNILMLKDGLPLNANKTELGFTFKDIMEENLLFISDNLNRDIKMVAKAISDNLISEKLIEERVKYLLSALINRRFESKQLNNSSDDNLTYYRNRVIENSIALVRNQKHLIPINFTEISSLSVIDQRAKKNSSAKEIASFHYYSTQWVDKIADLSLNQGKSPLFVFLCDNINQLASSALNSWQLKSKYPNSRIALILASQINASNYVANDYSCFDAIILGYQSDATTVDLCVQGLFGGISLKGKSVVSLKGFMERNNQLMLNKCRLKFGMPTEVGMVADSLIKIDKMIRDAIDLDAAPGAQIIIARNGTVVYRKAFGKCSYVTNEPVDFGKLYDIASVTKIMATTPMVMHLFENKRIDLNQTLKELLPGADNSNKATITLQELLIHKAGLPASMPTFFTLIDRQNLDGNLVSKKRTGQFSIQIDERLFLNSNIKMRADLLASKQDTSFSIETAKGLYLNKNYLDSIYFLMLTARVDPLKSYKYSDMGLCFLQRVIELKEKNKLNDLVDSIFYKPMGIEAMTYLPLKRFSLSLIVPTEYDHAFRKQLLRGYVHDPAAALLGGVSGNAGLFSNADEMAKMMQMYLNDGVYGQQRYFQPQTVQLFTNPGITSVRRGLGFDKPETDPDKVSPVCGEASPKSFGHLGFTGTIAWADPETGLVFIFLSNRVNPYGWNKKLTESNVRSKIMSQAYKSIAPVKK